MATRGFITFAVDGENKTAYNHWDSDPGALGLDVLTWAREITARLTATREAVRALRVVTDETEPTKGDIERLRPFADFTVDTVVWQDGHYVQRDAPSWHQLLNSTQGKPQKILSAGVIEDASTFPADSLWAEWGYAVDFDTDQFEVYRGFQDRPHKAGRFAHLAAERVGYFPVRLVASWPLAQLPSDDEFSTAMAALADF